MDACARMCWVGSALAQQCLKGFIGHRLSMMQPMWDFRYKKKKDFHRGLRVLTKQCKSRGDYTIPVTGFYYQIIMNDLWRWDMFYVYWRYNLSTFAQTAGGGLILAGGRLINGVIVNNYTTNLVWYLALSGEVLKIFLINIIWIQQFNNCKERRFGIWWWISLYS